VITVVEGFLTVKVRGIQKSEALRALQQPQGPQPVFFKMTLSIIMDERHRTFREYSKFCNVATSNPKKSVICIFSGFFFASCSSIE
jgi:hypothetical protein